MKAYEDINHKGKQCIEDHCTNEAGTMWSPYWCFSCNVKRINRINKQFDEMLKRDK